MSHFTKRLPFFFPFNMESLRDFISSSCSIRIPSFISSPIARRIMNITISIHKKIVCKSPQLRALPSAIYVLFMSIYPITRTSRPTTRSIFSKALVFLTCAILTLTSHIPYLNTFLYLWLHPKNPNRGCHRSHLMCFSQVVHPVRDFPRPTK